MAHFYGAIRGNRGEVTRTGSKNSGFNAHIRGWNVGVRVSCTYNAEEDRDEIYVYKTNGSNGMGSDRLLAIIKEGE